MLLSVSPRYWLLELNRKLSGIDVDCVSGSRHVQVEEQQDSRMSLLADLASIADTPPADDLTNWAIMLRVVV